MTKVLNLSTGEILLYTLPPKEAVIAAYLQSQGEWNTWSYAEKAGKLKVYHGKHSVSYGDFAALLEGGREND